MLDSDMTNPDDSLSVRFYDDVTVNNFLSEKEGRRVVQDVVRVSITPPGRLDRLELNEVATDAHKARFPVAWARYMNSKGGDDSMAGTPLSELTFLGRAAIENLKHARFYTVEQLANAPDAVMLDAGMGLGMDGLQVRERARRYLAFADKNAAFATTEARLAEKEVEIETLKGQMAQLMEGMRELQAKRGPGRPPKDSEAA